MNLRVLLISVLFFSSSINSKSEISRDLREIDIHSSEFSISQNQWFFLSISVFINDIADNNNRQQKSQRIFPNIQKYSYNVISINEEAGEHEKLDMKAYVFYADQLITRFERTDIICPFNTFW